MEPFWGLWLFKMLLKQLNNLKVKKNKLNFSFQMILPMNPIRSLIQMTHKMLQLKMIMKPFNLRMLLLMHQLIIQSMKKEKFLSLKDKLNHKILLKLKQKKKRSLELLSGGLGHFCSVFVSFFSLIFLFHGWMCVGFCLSWGSLKNTIQRF